MNKIKKVPDIIKVKPLIFRNLHSRKTLLSLLSLSMIQYASERKHSKNGIFSVLRHALSHHCYSQ